MKKSLTVTLANVAYEGNGQIVLQQFLEKVCYSFTGPHAVRRSPCTPKRSETASGRLLKLLDKVLLDFFVDCLHGRVV